jgi:hypothetical protein
MAATGNDQEAIVYAFVPEPTRKTTIEKVCEDISVRKAEYYALVTTCPLQANSIGAKIAHQLAVKISPDEEAASSLIKTVAEHEVSSTKDLKMLYIEAKLYMQFCEYALYRVYAMMVFCFL